MPSTLVKRLEQVAAVQRQRRAHRSKRDLAIFTDDEVEELCQLARKADTAKRLGQPVEWTADEILILDRLEATRRRDRGW
jgi:hypothetical protein